MTISAVIAQLNEMIAAVERKRESLTELSASLRETVSKLESLPANLDPFSSDEPSEPVERIQGPGTSAS